MATRKAAAATQKKSDKPEAAAAVETAKPVRKPAAAKPAARKKAAPAEKKPAEKKQKVKVVRDSFTMPREEYAKIAEIKLACSEGGLMVKKSEVLRAGLKLLTELSPVRLRKALTEVEKIKTGRPKKH